MPAYTLEFLTALDFLSVFVNDKKRACCVNDITNMTNMEEGLSRFGKDFTQQFYKISARLVRTFVHVRLAKNDFLSQADGHVLSQK